MINELKLQRLAEVQRKLSSRVLEKGISPEKVRKVGAVDVSYRGGTARAAFVLCSFPDCVLLKERTVETEVLAPYIPTFFFLRETKPLLLVTRGEKFDVLLVEGHGRAHPRGYGLASHVGLALKKPTIGVAKHPLRGSPRGSYRIVGKAYVSVGHLVDLKSAAKIVEAVLEGGYPKPLRLADRLSKGRL